MLVVLSILTLLLVLHIYRVSSSLPLYIKFKELRPIPKRVEVLYKGIKIGDVVSSKHTKDLEHSIVKIRIYPRNIKLPINTKAYLMIEKRRFHDYDYIELRMPQDAALECLKSGMLIDGESMIDMRNYFANQSKDSIDGIKDNLYQASENLNTTINALGELFVILQEMVQENQANLRRFTRGLANSADNIDQLTAKINATASAEEIDELMNNIQQSLSNIKISSENIKIITEQFSSVATNINSTLPTIINKTNSIILNIDKITKGVSGTLNKPFGGARLILGKSINDCR